jgi:hypothetical protein
MKEGKTLAQLVTELAYYERIRATTRSVDRQQRAARAIAARERQLEAFGWRGRADEHPGADHTRTPRRDEPARQRGARRDERQGPHLHGKGVSMSSQNGHGPGVATGEPILQFFRSEHLPEKLAAVSKPFGELAQQLVMSLPKNAERSVALRKLLEAKDAAVRAQLAE